MFKNSIKEDYLQINISNLPKKVRKLSFPSHSYEIDEQLKENNSCLSSNVKGTMRLPTAPFQNQF